MFVSTPSSPETQEKSIVLWKCELNEHKVLQRNFGCGHLMMMKVREGPSDRTDT